MTPRNTILVGDAAERLRALAPASVDCLITSPPYFLLRNYGHERQIGLESSVDDWVRALVGVLREAARVLVRTGSAWVVVSDTYARRPQHGAPPKSLVLGPERLALALMADGWIVRNKVVWAKPNPMPQPVGDRLANTYEVVYLVSRQRSYWFDLDAIRTAHRTKVAQAARSAPASRPDWTGPFGGTNAGLRRPRPAGNPGHPRGKNPGDVWTVAVRGIPGHHATFPAALLERPLLASCPLKVCTACGSGWRSDGPGTEPVADCQCAGSTRPGLVLDPFFGSGTVGVVAERHGRDWLGVELNPEYAALARRRITQARTISPATPVVPPSTHPAPIRHAQRSGSTSVPHQRADRECGGRCRNGPRRDCSDHAAP